MKYIIRAIKYFFYFAFFATAIILALVFIGLVEGDINAIFENGTNDLWKIIVFFAAVASVYPNLAFITRQMPAEEDRKATIERIKAHMSARHYVLESETAEGMTFRFHGLAGKLSKMFEDRITIKWNEEGYTMEGLRKDVLRLTAGL